jgi:hypothetical protein
MNQERIFAANCFFQRMRFIFSSALLFVTFLSSAQSLTTNSFQQSNTGYDELNPVISPDGRSQYITVANHPQNQGGKKDPGDIWVSVLTENNQWSAPQRGRRLFGRRKPDVFIKSLWQRWKCGAYTRHFYFTFKWQRLV